MTTEQFRAFIFGRILRGFAIYTSIAMIFCIAVFPQLDGLMIGFVLAGFVLQILAAISDLLALRAYTAMKEDR